uniref:Uncharacterized protein n=1 Tax=Arundo donax TaxID=35708 RepID=A0A0A9C1F9_ARUDO
MKYGGQQGLD